MAVPNHLLTFRPLIGGIAIINPLVNKLGTLGLVATSNGEDRWIVSAYHVLCRLEGAAFEEDEPIYQPFGSNPEESVGRLVQGRADHDLDFAAARIVDGIGASSWVLGPGRPSAPVAPAVGMRVLKSGMSTGVTEGQVTGISGDSILIEVVSSFSGTYDLSEIGDSGSAWFEAGSLACVALHTSGNAFGPEVARGIAMNRVLRDLGLAIPS